MQERGKADKGETCTGGRSFNCRTVEHPAGDAVQCYRCGTYLGCRRCAERPSEVICLECHNWGSRRGVKVHGNVVPNRKVPRVRTDDGWISEHRLSGEADRWVR